MYDSYRKGRGMAGSNYELLLLWQNKDLVVVTLHY